MSYVEENLIAGEDVLYKTGLHWMVLFWPTVLAVLSGLPGLILLIVGLSAAGDETGMTIGGVVTLAIGACCFLFGYVNKATTEMAVTNKRVVIKVGVLRRRTFEILLQKVESIGVEEGLLGRMLGYGLVVVRGTGGTPEPFKLIAHPREFRRQVQQQIEASTPDQASAQKVLV